MAKRTVYHVTYDKSKTYPWRVKKGGGSRAVSKHRKKGPAVRKAKSLAKDRKPSQIKVHNKNGRFDYEHTYRQDPARYQD